ncbi:hypothetical protein F9B85_13870 [Heliorestis acidaminivorans]|uniref:Uncharacterized protein n=1 Tax=Heliorestis acidaminivorans TaxID=553427 RepID=A0A6I0EWY5_9FIRM|nr:hypothetical protein [Heliorestis acidaminivorans]KAB2950832.1 hypothetical protein F9B85_13870 [Heliorestis acidaminivorans]
MISIMQQLLRRKAITLSLTMALFIFFPFLAGANERNSACNIDGIIPQTKNIEIMPVALSGQEMPEYVIVYHTEDLIPNGGVIVLKHTTECQGWGVVFRELYEGYRLKILDVGKLLGDQREQIAIGSHEGSGSFLSFFILGGDSRKIGTVLDHMEEPFFQGGLKIKEGDLYVHAASQGTIFQWDGTKFTESPYIQQPDLSHAKLDDFVVHYSIINDKVVANYPHGTILSLRKGQEVHFVRENYGATERILYMGPPDWDPSLSMITIIPNGYDWDNAYEIYVKEQ